MAREILAKAHELEDLQGAEVEQESNRVKFPHIVVGNVWFHIYRSLKRQKKETKEEPI
jgi:hypothetical protein